MPSEENHPPHSAQGLALRFMQANTAQARGLYVQLIQCPHCTEALRELDHWSNVVGHPSPRVAPEFVTRHRLYRDLSSDHRARQEAILGDSIYHHWGLCTLFLEQANQALARDPVYSLDQASTGLDIARLLPEDSYSRPLVQDLISKAHMQVLEAQLELGRTGEAVAILAKVRVHLRRGTRRPVLLAALDHLEARFLTLLGATQDALRILDRGLRCSLDALREPSRGRWDLPRHPSRFPTRIPSS